MEGHAYAEKLLLEQIWWPAVGHFEYLHPEYEVFDFRDGVRYLDFAYLRGYRKVNIEVDSFGAHSRDDRRKFSDDLQRQNHLVLDGWTVIRFSFEDVKDKPRQCQQIIQQMLGKLFGGSADVAFEALPLKQREIVRLAVRSNQPITPGEVSKLVGISNKYAHVLLQQLVEGGILLPASGNLRIRSYKLNSSSGFNNHILF